MRDHASVEPALFEHVEAAEVRVRVAEPGAADEAFDFGVGERGVGVVDGELDPLLLLPRDQPRGRRSLGRWRQTRILGGAQRRERAHEQVALNRNTRGAQRLLHESGACRMIGCLSFVS